MIDRTAVRTMRERTVVSLMTRKILRKTLKTKRKTRMRRRCAYLAWMARRRYCRHGLSLAVGLLLV